MAKPNEFTVKYYESDRYNKSEHKKDIKICKELCYPKEVIEAIKNERDGLKRQQIMTTARKRLR